MTAIWIKALRVSQWTKNAVVFAAWFFAVADKEQAALARGWRPFALVCAMALSFSLVSSAFYLLNDVGDYEADRRHPVKRNRPVAADLISKIDAVRAALALFAFGLAFPCYLVFRHPDRTWGFAVLLVYTVMQCAYSGFLKRVPYVDVAVIAAGFVLRAVAGAGAGGEAPVVELTAEDLTDDAIELPALLVRAELCQSRGDARRNIQQGGVTVDGEKITDIGRKFTAEELKKGILLRRGKKNYKQIVLK